MIRLNLNSANSGVLYHFAPNVYVVYSILKNGLRTGSNYESHMRHVDPDDSKMKSKVSKKFAENPGRMRVRYPRIKRACLKYIPVTMVSTVVKFNRKYPKFA